MKGINKVWTERKSQEVTRPNPSAQPNEEQPSVSRYLPDPPPPYFDRIIVGHGLPVEYRQSEDGEHYLKDGIYYFRRLNPAHPANHGGQRRGQAEHFDLDGARAHRSFSSANDNCNSLLIGRRMAARFQP